MKVTGFNHLTLRIRDLERSIVFYTGVLGLKLVHRGRTDAYLEWGTAWICLLQTDRVPAAQTADGTEPKAGFDHIAFTINEAEFERAADELKEAGVTIVRGPVKRGQGWSVNFLDPDGIELELHTSSLAERMRVWS